LIRRLWRYYYQGTDAIIFVVDAVDKGRIAQAMEELHGVLSDDLLQNSKLLVLANKQDLLGAMDGAEMAEKLKLSNLKQRTWYLQPCSAETGDGLFEGLDWLSQQL
jgi:GTPase SAR1 family protein